MIWPECAAGVWEGSMSDTPLALPALPDLASDTPGLKADSKMGRGYTYTYG